MIRIGLSKSSRGAPVALSFPSTPADMRNVYAALDNQEDDGLGLRVMYATSDVPSLDAYLKRTPWPADPSEQTALHTQLIFLSERLEQLNERELHILDGALLINAPGACADIVNLSLNLERYTLYPGVYSAESQMDAGGESHEETVSGRPHRRARAAFTDVGLVLWDGRELERFYEAGGNLPAPRYRVCKQKVFTVKLWELEKPGEYRLLNLPLSTCDESIASLRAGLGVGSLSESCAYEIASSPFRGLAERMPHDNDLAFLEECAKLLSKKLAGYPERLPVLLAALEGEMPGDMMGALHVITTLDSYDFIPAAEGRRFYDHYLEKYGIPLHSEIRPFLDAEAFERYALEREGAARTTEGYLCPVHHNIKELPEPSELKLYIPADMVLRGGSPDSLRILTADEARPFFAAYRERLKDGMAGNEDAGLSYVLKNELTKRRFKSIHPDLESRNNQLFFTLKCSVHGEPPPEELAYVKRELAEEMARGLDRELRDVLVRTGSGPGDLFLEIKCESADDILTGDALTGVLTMRL